MEHNRLEIVLVACGILILVALMSIVLWLGNRRRNEERRDSHESQRGYSAHSQGRECLFKEVFADHPDHDPALIRLNDYNGPSLITTIRKRSQTIADAVQHGLLDIRRTMEVESSAAGSQSCLDEQAEVDLLAESSTEGPIARNRSDTNATGRHSTGTRWRTSSIVELPRLKLRKSQEQPPSRIVCEGLSG